MDNKRMRVLLLEDDPEDARLLREMVAGVSSASLDWTQVERLSTALQRLAAEPFDVILADLSLPDSEGLATFTQLQAQAAGVPIVVLSGYDDEALALQAVQAGAQDYLVKGHTDGYLLVRALRYAVERQQAERALRENETRFRTVIENSTDAITLVGPDGTLLFTSPASRRLWGYEGHEYIGRQAWELVHPSDLAEVMTLFTDLAQKPGHSLTHQYRIRHKDGSWRWIEGTGTNLLAEPSVQAIVVNARDITERKRVEEALRESQENLAVAQRITHLGSWELGLADLEDVTKNPLRWSDEVFHIFGYQPGEIEVSNENFYRGVHPDDREPIREAVAEALRRGKPYSLDHRIILPDGTERIVHEQSAIIYDEKTGRPQKMVGTVQDITERKRAEAELAAERHMLRTLIDNLPDYIYVKDAESRFVLANVAVARLMGAATPNELLGKTDFDYYPPELAQRYYEDEQAVIRSGEPRISQEEPVVDAAGNTGWVSTTQVPLRDSQGKSVGLVGLGRDITERRQIEAAEREQRALAEALRDTAEVLNRSLDFEAVLDRILANVGRVVPHDAADVMLIDSRPGESSVARAVRSRGYAERGLEAWLLGLRLRLGDAPVLWKMAQTGRPVASFDSQDLPNWAEQPELSWLRSYLGAPIRSKGKTIGFLNLASALPNFFTADQAARLQIFADQAAIALENARLLRETERRANEFGVLYGTIRDLATERDLPTLLQTIVERTMQLLEVDVGSMYVYDTGQQNLELVAAKGFPFPLGTRLRLGEGMAGRVAQTRRPLIVNNYQTWAHRSPQYEGFPLAAVVEVPMLYGGELIGVLAASQIGTTPRQFTEADVHLLSLFAAQAASAVYNARLFEVTRARAEQLALVYDAGLALNSVLEPRAQLELLFKTAMQALHADRAEFFRYDAAQDALRFELGIGQPEAIRARLQETVVPGGDENILIGWVSKHRQSLNLPDVTGDARWEADVDTSLRSALWVPVEHEHQLRGVFGLLSTRPNAFTLQDEWLLGLFANQAAVALENARLFDEAQRRAEELAAINTLGRTLAETLELERIYAQLYEAAGQLLPDIVSVIISLYDPERELITCAFAVHEAERLNARELPPIPLEAPGVGTQSEAIRTRRPLIANDLPARLKQVKTNITVGSSGPMAQSGLYVPMLAKGEVIGVVQVQSRTRNRFRPADAELLSFVANTAAIAIANARLFSETNRHLKNLQALRAIDAAITSSFDLRVTLDVLLDQATLQLGIHAADILLVNKHAKTLEYAAGRGFRGSGITRSRMRLGEGAAGRAALERRTIGIPNLAQSEERLVRPALPAGEDFVAYYAMPLVARGQVKGVLEIFHREPLEPDREWLDFLDALAGQAAIAIDNAALFDDLQRSNIELTLAYDATIEGWSKALDLRDRETEGHTQRVTEMTLRLARAMHMKDEDLVHVHRGALLHDIGKMGIPDSILLKPGPLSAEEWAIMRKHPEYAYQMLSPISHLRAALDIPYCHHEKWDGTGYPRGLKGEAIPLAARVFAVVDVWDALRSDRPYRAAWPEDKVHEHLRAQGGIYFDPQVVEAFLRPEMWGAEQPSKYG